MALKFEYLFDLDDQVPVAVLLTVAFSRAMGIVSILALLVAAIISIIRNGIEQPQPIIPWVIVALAVAWIVYSWVFVNRIVKSNQIKGQIQ